MAQPNQEKHFTASDTLREVVIGMSDGLTVPFAITAGMTGATMDASAVIIGLAEIKVSAAFGLANWLG